MTTIFLRNDDAGELTVELRQFVDIFQSANLPVSYQIIPARLSDECAAYLCQRKAVNPELFEFGQHGYTHHVTINGKVHNHEYGSESDYETQLASIQAGRAILDQKLSTTWNGTLFTPPCHKFDRNTLKALAASSFSILSASAYVEAKYRFAYRIGRLLGRTNVLGGGVTYHGGMRPEAPLAEMSIAVAVDNGGPTDQSVDEVISRFQKAKQFTPNVGLMFHHNAYREPHRLAFLKQLTQALRRLDNVCFSLIGDLVQAPMPRRPRRDAA